ncbi:MAG: MerR family transcriptional regulator [Agathobacter sp.]|nr:MerR family transcriptional regulator [Agathobacter sp.]
MKINEIENQLGLSRANVRYYEKEGLLSPERKDNGYREYSEKDIAILKKIIIFRKLGLSLPEIKEILSGTLEVSVAIEKNIEQLTKQIAELNGALEISQMMKNDSSVNDSFDEEHYWNLIQTKEQNGEKFADVLKDYVELEKNAFLSMWESAFFLRIRDKVKKYGWKSVLLFLLVFCILRGIVQEVFDIGGSFLEGFAYPFFLYGMISLAILPIFYIHKKYKDTPPEELKPARHPYLMTALKALALISYIIGYLIGPAALMENYFFPLDDSISYSATFDLYILYWIIGLFVMCMLIYLYSKRGIFPDLVKGEDGIKCTLPRKVRYKITGFCAVVLILSIFPSFAWYDCATEDGLIVQRFAYNKSYTWEEIDYYTLSADFQGTLIFSVVMQDGTKADCIGGSPIGISHLPEDKYPDYDYDFARYLARKFTDMGIELKVKYWSKLYKALKYDSWIELAEDIREIAGK